MDTPTSDTFQLDEDTPNSPVYDDPSSPVEGEDPSSPFEAEDTPDSPVDDAPSSPVETEDDTPSSPVEEDTPSSPVEEEETPSTPVEDENEDEETPSTPVDDTQAEDIDDVDVVEASPPPVHKVSAPPAPPKAKVKVPQPAPPLVVAASGPNKLTTQTITAIEQGNPKLALSKLKKDQKVANKEWKAKAKKFAKLTTTLRKTQKKESGALKKKQKSDKSLLKAKAACDKAIDVCAKLKDRVTNLRAQVEVMSKEVEQAKTKKIKDDDERRVKLNSLKVAVKAKSKAK